MTEYLVGAGLLIALLIGVFFVYRAGYKHGNAENEALNQRAQNAANAEMRKPVTTNDTIDKLRDGSF